VRDPCLASFIAGSLALSAALQSTVALAAEGAQAEHVVILELGASAEREISERNSHIGPAVGIEFEPIENWLEIEFGASAHRSRGATTWDLELPFKKPFRLSEAVEVMPGLGPTWSHTAQAGQRRSVWGAAAVVDFFFWQSKRVGWFLEPSYGIAFGNNNNKSIGVTGVFSFRLKSRAHRSCA
jgi:hypothetical protein